MIILIGQRQQWRSFELRQWWWRKQLNDSILSVRAEFISRDALVFFRFRIAVNLFSFGIGLCLRTCNRTMHTPSSSSFLFPITLYHCKLINCNPTMYNEKENESKRKPGKANIKKDFLKPRSERWESATLIILISQQQQWRSFYRLTLRMIRWVSCSKCEIIASVSKWLSKWINNESVDQKFQITQNNRPKNILHFRVPRGRGAPVLALRT